jgi:hypothetical protein
MLMVPPPPNPVNGAVTVHVVMFEAKVQAPHVTRLVPRPCEFGPTPVKVSFWLMGPKLITVAEAAGAKSEQ